MGLGVKGAQLTYLTDIGHSRGDTLVCSRFLRHLIRSTMDLHMIQGMLERDQAGRTRIPMLVLDGSIWRLEYH